MGSKTTWSIGGLSAASGCHVETIRYYERIALLPEPPRSAGGHRVFGPEHLKRLGFIRRCRELGFPVETIRELLGLLDEGRYTCEEVRERVLGHLEQVRERMRSLRTMERALDRMAAECTGGRVPECHFIESLYDR